MTTETITEQGHRHGTEYADHHWQIWPAHYTEAVEWCAAAEAGTLHEYGLPDDAAAPRGGARGLFVHRDRPVHGALPRGAQRAPPPRGSRSDAELSESRQAGFVLGR